MPGTFESSSFQSAASQSGSFQTTSWGWQLHQWGRQVSEWLELQLANRSPEGDNPSGWALPDWLLKLGFWVIISLLLGWAGWQLWRWGSLYDPFNRRHDRLPRPSSAIAPSRTDWVRQSQRMQQQGNYREACRALYLAMLQQLHDRQVISNQSSRTDGEYLQVVQQLPQPQPYQTLIQTHEQLCFGSQAISAQTFAQCQQAYREIEQA